MCTISPHCRSNPAEKLSVKRVYLFVGLWMAIVAARQDEWPPATRLERTPACPTAVLLLEPSHEDAEQAVAEFAATLGDEPTARGHVVVLAGAGPLPASLWKSLRTLPRTELHFVQDDGEMAAFGAVNGLGFYLFDVWGRLKKQNDRSGEAPVELASFRKT
jgi:hypothetical protein